MLPAVSYHVDTICEILAAIFLHTSLNSQHYLSVRQFLRSDFIYFILDSSSSHECADPKSDSTATTHLVIMKTTWQ